jgi:hypothetical protein
MYLNKKCLNIYFHKYLNRFLNNKYAEKLVYMIYRLILKA